MKLAKEVKTKSYGQTFLYTFLCVEDTIYSIVRSLTLERQLTVGTRSAIKDNIKRRLK